MECRSRRTAANNQLWPAGLHLAFALNPCFSHLSTESKHPKLWGATLWRLQAALHHKQTGDLSCVHPALSDL